jgi:hypothetical protein
MFYPYAEANWDVVDGAMFIGWGTSLTGLSTLVAAAICVLVLVVGLKKEAENAKAFDK